MESYQEQQSLPYKGSESYCLSGDDYKREQELQKKDKWHMPTFIGGLILFAIVFAVGTFGDQWGIPIEKYGKHLAFVATLIVALISLGNMLKPLIYMVTRPKKIVGVCVETDYYRQSASNDGGTSRAVYFAPIDGKDYILFFLPFASMAALSLYFIING